MNKKRKTNVIKPSLGLMTLQSERKTITCKSMFRFNLKKHNKQKKSNKRIFLEKQRTLQKSDENSNVFF